MPESALINQNAETKPIAKGMFKDLGLDKRHFVRRAKAMVTERAQWDPTWKDLQTYNYPTRGSFSSTPNQGSMIDHKTLIDEEATLDADIFKSGMTSGSTSPSRPWFEFFLEDEMLMKIPRVKYWLDDARNRMLDIYHKANAYTALTSMYLELSVFATACSFIEEDFDNVIRVSTYTIGEYSLASDDKGRINAFYREFFMTAGQMVEHFGKENCSERVQQAYKDNKPDQWFKVNHLIEANNDRVPFLRDYRNMPWRSIYWENGTENDDSYLRVGGYEEFPIVAPRWDTRDSTDTYGRGSPGWKALGAVKELQRKKKALLIALDKITNPSLQADASVVGEVNTLPGGITRFSAQLPNAGVKPTYEVKLDIASLDISIKETKATIKQFFFTNLFMMMLQADQNRKQITATEIIEKQSERLSMLGPILERWEGEDFLKAWIDRTFNVALRTGALAEPPPELTDVDIKIRYTSILALAQRMQDMAPIDQWIAAMIEKSTVEPAILDNVNWDEYANETARILGIPAKIQNSPDGIAAKRKARQVLEEQARRQQQLMVLAEAGSKGAGAVKDMADAPMGTGSAMDATMQSINQLRGQ